ncbi:DUF748 domain-containing protein [Paraburkholderia ferrariae]|uniref:DUF748 domain-containing protein n=1 Tax=Paraburkholderia ferrariae TaxID=386056 RepID=UPI000483EED3|nr:DUF748 domain-containing protein [Paraburkholderia ferrariae]
MTPPPTHRTLPRFALVAAIVVAVLVLGALGGLYLLQREAKARVAEALAPIGTAGRIDVAFTLTSVELSDVHLKAPPGWPTADSLHAARITLAPDLRALLAHRIHIRDVTVRGFTMNVLRRADGSIQILPNLRSGVENPGAPPASGASAPPASLPAEKRIDHVAFEAGEFVFYDRSVSNPPYRVTVSDASATVDNIHLPALAEPTQLSVTGAIKGPQHTGQVSFRGWVRIANKDSQTTTTLRGVDISTLDPWLLRKARTKARVTGGTLDLDLDSTVNAYRLHAPGTITLHQLQLAPSSDPLDTFLAIPTRIAIAALKAHNGDITLHFVLDGNLRDPKFHLDESLTTDLRAGFAKALGVSAEGVVQGAGQTAKGLTDALRNLLGGGTATPPSR